MATSNGRGGSIPATKIQRQTNGHATVLAVGPTDHGMPMLDGHGTHRLSGFNRNNAKEKQC